MELSIYFFQSLTGAEEEETIKLTDIEAGPVHVRLYFFVTVLFHVFHRIKNRLVVLG